MKEWKHPVHHPDSIIRLARIFDLIFIWKKRARDFIYFTKWNLFQTKFFVFLCFMCLPQSNKIFSPPHTTLPHARSIPQTKIDRYNFRCALLGYLFVGWLLIKFQRKTTICLHVRSALSASPCETIIYFHSSQKNEKNQFTFCLYVQINIHCAINILMKDSQ